MAISFQSPKCPSCGANLSGKDNGKQLKCPYCGTTLLANDDAAASAPHWDLSPDQINIHVENVVYQAPQPASAPQRPQPAPTQAPQVEQAFRAPVGQLKTNKGLIKTILLSLITYGIYAIVVMSSVSNDINIVASRYDGKRTMHFCLLLFIVGPLTLGIGALVWFHKISARIGHELWRRGLPYSFGAGDFWLWGVLGSFILIGPLVYLHKLFKAMNSVCAHYNIHG